MVHQHIHDALDEAVAALTSAADAAGQARAAHDVDVLGEALRAALASTNRAHVALTVALATRLAYPY